MNSGINMKNRTSCPKELCGIFTQTNKEKKVFPRPLALILHKKNIFSLLFHHSGGCHSFSIETTYFCPTIFGWHLIVCGIKAKPFAKDAKYVVHHIFFSPNKSSLVVDPKNQLQTECASKCKISVEITPLNIL